MRATYKGKELFHVTVTSSASGYVLAANPMEAGDLAEREFDLELPEADVDDVRLVPPTRLSRRLLRAIETRELVLHAIEDEDDLTIGEVLEQAREEERIRELERRQMKLPGVES